MTDARSAELTLPEEIDKGTSGAMDLLRTINERTATLLEGQYRQRELLREVIDGLGLGDPQMKSARRNELHDDGLQWLEDWLSEHDRRFDRIEKQTGKQIQENGRQFDLVHGKLDVILKQLQEGS